MRFKPQEGLEVIATGKLTTYPGSSKYQIVIDAMEPAGVGALMAMMEERKKKLAAEGLFDEARKQLLPWLPEVIGVVTSPTGAVIRDILHRLGDRFPRRVLVWPVKVQGEGSAEQVAAAIRGFNALPEGGHDAAAGSADRRARRRLAGGPVVVQRGDRGARRRRSMIPLISAVGHETDITLIDFAADQRAPTPTAAAEMAVPVRSELFVEVESLARRTMVCWRRGQESRRNELRAAARALPGSSELLAIPRQRLDQRGAALPRALKANAHAHHRRFSHLSRRPDPEGIARTGRAGQPPPHGVGRTHPAVRPRAAAQPAGPLCRARGPAEGLKALQRAGAAQCHRARPRAHERLAERARRALLTAMQRLDARVAHRGQLLSALSYRGVLARGFALVRDEHGHAVHAAAAIGPNARLSIEFADGCVGATADADRPAGHGARRGGTKAATQEAKPAAPKRDGQAGRSGQSVLAYRASHSVTRRCASFRASASVPMWPRSGKVASAPAIARSGRLARSKSWAAPG